MPSAEFEIADFRRFRFFRDAHENIVSMDAQVFGEKLFPVADVRDFRLARLHVHEQAARKRDWRESFEQEMALLAELDDRFVSVPLESGQDEDELFYINDLRNGEELPGYLARAGALSPQMAGRWLCPFVSLMESLTTLPLSLRRVHNPNFQVVRNEESGQTELHLTEFTEWTKPGNLVVERKPDFFLAQSFLSLISGIPIREFTEDSLPRQFKDLSDELQNALLSSLRGEGQTESLFYAAIRKLDEEAQHYSARPPLPRSTFGQWMRLHIDQAPGVAPFRSADESGENLFLCPGEFDALPSLTHFIPGTSTIPKEGWFPQHALALRRPGKNFANQLAVFHVEESPAVLAIVEERPQGVSFGELIKELGPLDLDHTVAMAKRLSSALDGLESNLNATPVWWLPPGNVFLNIGTADLADYREAMEYEGPDFWERVPFRLRLHQTFRDLQQGIVLPENLRSLTVKFPKENPHIRRTAVLLPLAAFSLSGKTFQWNQPFEIENEEVPTEVAPFIDKTRAILVEQPQRLKLGFLKRLEDFLDQWDHKTYAAEAGHEVHAPAAAAVPETAPTTDQPQRSDLPKSSPSPAPNDIALQEILHEKLGADKIEIIPPVEETLLSPLHPDYTPPEQVSTTGDPSAGDPVTSFNPIAADVAQKNRKDKAALRAAQRERVERLQEERRAAARELLGLDRKAEPSARGAGFGILPWIAGAVAALLLGGAASYLAYGKATREGTVAAEIDSFPRSGYEEITPLVNPFTDLVGPIPKPPTSRRNSRPATPPADGAAAIIQSKLAVQQKQFAEAVNLALMAVELNPDSPEAGAQLDSALQAWIESGIAAPAATKDPGAIQVLAEYYLADPEKPLADGLYLLMAAALRQDTAAMRIYGLIFAQGRLAPKSPSIAERWLRQAAEKGDPDAQFYYGESALLEGIIPGADDALSFLEKAAAVGHPRALLFLGHCYASGLTGDKDEAKGFDLISRAAEKQGIEAIDQRGLCYANGIGVGRDERAAAASFKAAADLGHVPAMFHYGQCLITGFGVAKHFPDGVSWMKKAAAAGFPAAQHWCQRHGQRY